MKDFGFIPEWSKSPDRATELGYFPASPVATVRESTFSDTIAGILGAAPTNDINRLRSAFMTETYFKDPEVAAEVWDAFRSTYIISGEKGAQSSGGEANEYLIPFHHAVIRRIEIEESRDWYRWYWMLMTDEQGAFDDQLHNRFVTQLTNEDPSNLLEKLVINAADKLDDTTTTNSREPTAIPPLLPSLANAFREDLRTWLDLRPEESLSRWMQELRDIMCFHYMVYFIQLSKSLQEEYTTIENQLPLDDDETVAFKHTVDPIYYGLAHEQAAGTRPYATEWDEGGIGRAIYDSWGRLVVQRHLMEEAHRDENDVEPGAYTLTAAIREFTPEAKASVIDSLKNELPADQQTKIADDLSLPTFALQFAATVRRYYTNMGSSKRSQTAYTGGYNAIRQLGSGVDQEFIEARRRVGTISRLDRPGIRLLARVFEEQSGDGHIDGFWRYLRERGSQLDHKSKRELIKELDDMGMIEKRSDGEEAIYVQTI